MPDDEPRQPGKRQPGERRPAIDVSPALHEAGHEVEALGFEDVPDTGPLVGTQAEADERRDAAIEHAATEFPAD